MDTRKQKAPVAKGSRTITICAFVGMAIMLGLNLLFGSNAGFPGGAVGGAIGGGVGSIVGMGINKLRR
jgi:hypothetical protein